MEQKTVYIKKHGVISMQWLSHNLKDKYEKVNKN